MAYVRFWADSSGNLPASRNSDTLYFVTNTGQLYKGDDLIADKTPDSLPNAFGFNLYAQNDAQGNAVLVGTYDGSSAINLKAGAFVQLVKNSDGTITIESQNTTYSADKGIKLNGTTFEHTNAITAGKTNAATNTLAHGGKFKVPIINYDAQGHLTSVSEAEYTLPSDNNTLGKNIVGSAATSTANAAVTSNGVYLNHIEGSGTVKSKHKISGDGTVVKVTSDSNGNITITGTDTHYTTGITAGAANATANSTAEVTNPYINIKDDSTHRSGIQLKGDGATSVKAINGAITIASTDTWNANTGTQAGYVASPNSAKNKVWGTGSSGTPAWIDFSAEALGLGNAVHFLGTTTTELADNATTNPIVIDSKNVTAVAGDVVLYDGKEYIFTAGSKWQLFGDEGSYAVKTRSVTGEVGLTGGGDLTADRKIKANLVSETKATAAASATAASNANRLYPVSLDKNGKLAVTVPWTDTTYTANGGITLSGKNFALTNTYAGGTAVTLNGTSKAAATASFYAPTGAGNSGQVLQSSGSGAPSWVDQSTLAVGSAIKDGANNTITTTYATKTALTTVSNDVDALMLALTWHSGPANPPT